MEIAFREQKIFIMCALLPRFDGADNFLFGSGLIFSMPKPNVTLF
jgi:hypothetical protein